MADEKALTIQERRGMTPPSRERERKYNPASYAAQYGITVEDAEDLVSTCSDHPAVERAIFAMFRDDPALRRKALMVEEHPPTSPEEEERIQRWMKQHGISDEPPAGDPDVGKMNRGKGSGKKIAVWGWTKGKKPKDCYEAVYATEEEADAAILLFKRANRDATSPMRFAVGPKDERPKNPFGDTT